MGNLGRAAAGGSNQGPPCNCTAWSLSEWTDFMVNNLLTFLLVALFIALGVSMAVWPQKYVVLMARQTKRYKELYGLTEEDLEKLGWSGTRQRLLGGSVSRFAEEGEQQPEKYIAAVYHIRVWGVVMTTIFVGTCLLGAVLTLLGIG